MNREVKSLGYDADLLFISKAIRDLNQGEHIKISDVEYPQTFGNFYRNVKDGIIVNVHESIEFEQDIHSQETSGYYYELRRIR